MAETDQTSGWKQRGLRRILIVHHFVSEAGQFFRPDVLPVQTSFVANGVGDRVLPANIEALVEISPVLRISILS